MRIVCWDSETALFRPGVMSPELVCVTWMSPGEDPQIIHVKDPGCLPLLKGWLTDPEVLLVGHHVPYDLAVICAQWAELVPLVFAALDADRITDTKIRSQLLDIAAGEFRGKLIKFSKEVVDKETGEKSLVQGMRWYQYNYDLDALLWRASGRRLDKDTWRLRYGEFIDIPISEWPEGACLYPLEDAKATLEVFLKQEIHADPYLVDQFRQTRAAWALHLTSVWGLRTHKAGVDALEKATQDALAEIEDGLKAAGLVRHDGSRDTKKAAARMTAVCAAAGKPLRLTEKGGISLDKESCEASEDSTLVDYAALTSLKTVLAKDIPIVRGGLSFPVHCNYGMAASGRSTASNPNVQNSKRKHGIREVWAPRDGFVYAQADFTALELHGLAQVCLCMFGESELAKVLNAGRDPHTEFACSMLGISYEIGMQRKEDPDDEEFGDSRQAAKVAAFGYGGGMGAASLVDYARKGYKVILTETRAKELKAAWLARFPEMVKYFAYIGDLTRKNEDGLASITHLFSNRQRGGCFFTAAANSFFQGISSDAAKRAMYLTERSCYAEPQNVLYGSRVVLFCHDEQIMEVLDDWFAHDKATEMSRLMCAGAKEFMPDVPPRAAPQLTRVWSKAAKPIYDKPKGDPTRRLVPWQPAT